MAFFSNQGNPFSQAVGTMESTSRRVGLLTAYRNGSLGADCPPCNCPLPPPGEGGSGGQSQDESDSAFAFRTPVAWHDGIFQAPKGEVGVPRSYFDGTVGTDPTELPVTSVGSTLYLNGRPYAGPLTIQHSVMGLGADEPATDLILDASKAPGLVDLKNLIRFWVGSPIGKQIGLDINSIPAGWVNTPWTLADGMLIQTILNKSGVPSPDQLKARSYDTLVAPTLTVGDQFYPLPQLIFYLAASLRGAAPSEWEGFTKYWASPFFKNMIPFWTEAFQQLSKMVISGGAAQDAQIMAAGLRVYPESVTITWPDGTVTRGAGVVTKGATTQKESTIPGTAKPGVIEKKEAVPASTNYLLYGGLAAVAVGVLYFTMKGPSRK